MLKLWKVNAKAGDAIKMIGGSADVTVQASYCAGGGLAGADITTTHFHRVIDETEALLTGSASTEPVWLNEKD